MASLTFDEETIRGMEDGVRWFNELFDRHADPTELTIKDIQKMGVLPIEAFYPYADLYQSAIVMFNDLCDMIKHSGRSTMLDRFDLDAYEKEHGITLEARNEHLRNLMLIRQSGPDTDDSDSDLDADSDGFYQHVLNSVVDLCMAYDIYGYACDVGEIINRLYTAGITHETPADEITQATIAIFEDLYCS